MCRPWEAPYKVSLAKIQIFTLKGGNFSVQKVENMIRVITCPKNIRFSWLFSKIFYSQAPFHYIHACVLILDNLTITNLYLHLLKSFPSRLSSASWCQCHQC